MLVDESLVEKRRGLGMYVGDGATDNLRQGERERFLREEWPLVCERIERLGLSVDDLIADYAGGDSHD
jgi:GntR family transcriptional regulator